MPSEILNNARAYAAKHGAAIPRRNALLTT